MGEPGHLCLPTNLPAQPGSVQSDGPRLSQNHIDCPRVAQHALVLGPGQSIGSGSLNASAVKESGDTTLQWADSPKPQEP